MELGRFFGQKTEITDEPISTETIDRIRSNSDKLLRMQVEDTEDLYQGYYTDHKHREKVAVSVFKYETDEAEYRAFRISTLTFDNPYGDPPTKGQKTSELQFDLTIQKDEDTSITVRNPILYDSSQELPPGRVPRDIEGKSLARVLSRARRGYRYINPRGF